MQVACFTNELKPSSKYNAAWFPAELSIASRTH